jgi:hypothetical protein
MSNTDKTAKSYACEPLAGCVYSYAVISKNAARRLQDAGAKPHVIELTAGTGAGYEYRVYYALDLHQATAKATELLVRMRRQQVRVSLSAIRPACPEETEAFFSELAKYDGHVKGETNRCRR